MYVRITIYIYIYIHIIYIYIYTYWGRKPPWKWMAVVVHRHGYPFKPEMMPKGNNRKKEEPEGGWLLYKT